MSRALTLLVLLASAACAPAPRPVSPVAAPPRVKAVVVRPSPQPPATYHGIPGVDPGKGMPVAVPDTTRLEPMPVIRDDPSNDRAMVVRGNGSRWFQLRGPAKAEPSPSPDSILRIAPRP